MIEGGPEWGRMPSSVSQGAASLPAISYPASGSLSRLLGTCVSFLEGLYKQMIVKQCPEGRKREEFRELPSYTSGVHYVTLSVLHLRHWKWVCGLSGLLTKREKGRWSEGMETALQRESVSERETRYLDPSLCPTHRDSPSLLILWLSLSLWGSATYRRPSTPSPALSISPFQSAFEASPSGLGIKFHLCF